jgi:hypothetical protein
MRYCIQPATSADVAYLALAMDPESAEWGGGNEIERANRLLTTCASSTQVWAARDAAGTPCALWGVTPKWDDVGIGCLWLVAGEQFGEQSNDFCEVSGMVLAEMLSEFPRLENLVEARKDRAIDMLRSIGFKVEPAATHLASGKLCHLVWMEAGGFPAVDGLHAVVAADRPARLN